MAKKEARAGKRTHGRCRTGIPGFDELVQGGLPLNSTTLICGGPGAGKTIFGLQFIYHGAVNGEKGVYITFEQKPEALRNQARQFGWDLEKLEKQGKLKIISITPIQLDAKNFEQIKKEIKQGNYKRLVIDSISTLAVNAPIYTKISDIALKDVLDKSTIFSPPIIGDMITKHFIYDFIDRLKELDCTSLLTSEASQVGDFLSRDTISEFVCDGVVMITFESMGGEFSRSLIIRKMRQTKNDEDVHPVEISKEGIIVHKIE